MDLQLVLALRDVLAAGLRAREALVVPEAKALHLKRQTSCVPSMVAETGLVLERRPALGALERAKGNSG